MSFSEVAFRSTWPYTILWNVAVLIMPLISVAVVLHSWIAWRRGKRLLWHSRVIKMAALFVIMATLLRVISTIRYVCYYAAAKGFGETEQAMAYMNIYGLCSLLSIGIVVSAFCLLLAQLVPIKGVGLGE